MGGGGGPSLNGSGNYFPSGSTMSQASLTQEQSARDYQARAAFSAADKDKNGYITFGEFLESLRELHVSIPYHDALDRFSKLDTDKDGRVVETEYVYAYLNDKFICGSPRIPSDGN